MTKYPKESIRARWADADNWYREQEEKEQAFMKEHEPELYEKYKYYEQCRKNSSYEEKSIIDSKMLEISLYVRKKYNIEQF